TMDDHPIRHKKHQTFNKFRTVEPSKAQAKGKAKSILESLRSFAWKPDKPHQPQQPQYQYKTVPQNPKRVTPVEIRAFVQLSQKTCRAVTKEKAKEQEMEEAKEVAKNAATEDEKETTEQKEEATRSARDVAKRAHMKLHPLSSLKKLAFTVVTKLARDVYDMYIAKHAQAVRPDNWMATSNFLAPLAQEMAKDFTMLWESQNEQMIKQFKKRDGGDGRFFDERTLPKESLLVRFLHLRELVDVAKRPVAVPISPIRHGFITITEQELFYSIHDSFREDVLGALKMDSTKKYKLNELEATFKRIAPDEFLCNLICPSKSLNLNPKATCNQYTKRYVLTGTFQTDGLQLRLLACDTRVTKGYKPSNPVPGRVDPKMGTDRWLKEIRNEFSGSAKELQDTDGRDVCIGGIDLGQVVTAAVSVLILDPPLADGTLPWPPTGKYCTLNIKQKALMQPQFKYRRAIEGRKTDEIHDAESSLLPRRGILDEDVRLFLNSMDKNRQ
ncbi:hypothetical protein BGZ54_004449, partial [Gamsiella multidivaricata]